MSAELKTKTPARWVPVGLGVAILSISFAAIFFRKASPTHPLIIAATRLSIASVLLAPMLLKAYLKGTLSRRMIQTGIMAGLLYGIHFGTWVSSLTMTSVASSVTLVTATPIIVAFIALLTGTDRPSKRDWLALGMAIIGLSAIGWNDLSVSGDALFGDLLALIGAAAMAVYLVVARRLGKELDVLAFGAIATFVGAIALFSIAIIFQIPIIFASSESLFWVVLAALVPQLIGHNLLTWSVRYATPTAVGIATVGEPVGATFLAWAWLDETVSPTIAVGATITLCAVFLSARASAQKPSKSDQKSIQRQPS